MYLFSDWNNKREQKKKEKKDDNRIIVSLCNVLIVMPGHRTNACASEATRQVQRPGGLLLPHQPRPPHQRLLVELLPDPSQFWVRFCLKIGKGVILLFREQASADPLYRSEPATAWWMQCTENCTRVSQRVWYLPQTRPAAYRTKSCSSAHLLFI